MKKILNHILLAGALAMVGLSATAQNTRTGYFLEDYTYRFQMNPAMENSKGFFAMPALGNLNIQERGTLGVSDILYNVNGRTATFMHPDVPASEVMSNIKDKNLNLINFNTPIIALGFKGFGGYNTLSLSTVVESNEKIPGSIFSLLKEGISNRTYDIGALHATATAYAQIQLGHSHKITDDLRIGVNLKALLGAGDVRLDMDHADLELGTDAWRIITEGQVNAHMKGLRYETDVNSTTGHRYVNDIKVESSELGISGMGVGIDLGAVYSPSFLPDFKFSAAVLDLGFINWSNNMVASTQGQRVFSTDKYTFNVDKDAPNSFDNEFDKIKDELSSLYELSDLGDQGSELKTLASTLNVGVEYTLPVYKAARFGLLSTTRFNGEYTWTDLRLSANWVPCRVFDLALSGSVGTFGLDLGWLVNLHCTGFNLFVGMDCMPTKYSKDMIPLSSRAALNMGLNFLF